jgi:hypothetical protein
MSTKQTLADLLNVLDQLPKPAPIVELPKCACCKKTIQLNDIRVIQSPVAGSVTDNVCKSCADTLKDLCPIVCVGCKLVVAKLDPGTNKNGFSLVPGRSYHIRDCPVCNKNKYEGKVIESKLVEEEIYLKRKTK